MRPFSYSSIKQTYTHICFLIRLTEFSFFASLLLKYKKMEFHTENLMSEKDDFPPELILYGRAGPEKRECFQIFEQKSTFMPSYITEHKKIRVLIYVQSDKL